MGKYFGGATKPAAVSLVSLMVVTGAAAQDAKPETAPAQQQTTTTPDKPATTQQGATLPEIQVRSQKKRVARPARSTTPPPPSAAPPPQQQADTQDTRTGTVGIYANSTSVATKTNTPLVNIPQSITVITKDFIKDQNPTNLTDVTRYVPGVAIHQGEGNRDELVIRGVDSSANFFVNGFRDDVQIFRDLYNTQSIEVLKGPSALTFGRGVGGGLVNRTLKEAEFYKKYEATMQTGSYADRRFTLDANQAINSDFAVRLNGMYEGSDTFRDFGKLERYGINPTITWRPTQQTKVRVSYEYFHDERTADRGNPSYSSFGLPVTAATAAFLRTFPASPFAPNGDITKFYGSPSLNVASATVSQVFAFIDHDFQNGLTVKNGTMYSNYKKFYQNAYPGNGPLAGAVNIPQTGVNLAAYNHETDRENTFNQTDFVYKRRTGFIDHTLGFGTEFGKQTGFDLRNTGIFPNGTNTIVANPYNPTYFGNINFIHHYTGVNADGVTTPDSNSRYGLNTSSGYIRDTMDMGWLQLLGGLRFDRFDLTATDQNTNTVRGRVDEKVSKQGAVILKPLENLSIYTMYSTSFLPASGDQFSALTGGTVILAPQQFINKEAGLKWNILPRLQYTLAYYDLKRINVPIADPSNPGFFILSGSHRIKGMETALNGYITNEWQAQLGYAYTDARIAGATSTTVVPGNRVQLVPLHQVSLWNKYQFTPTWAAALGVIYFSDSFASSDDTVKLPGFVRFDTALYYKFDEHWKAQLNVENVLNTRYWASADGNNNISPGQGRTFKVMATATY